MKSVMLSIKPKDCELIANGKMTIRVLKNRPKIETPFTGYIYCTKGKSINNVFLIYGGGKYACFGDYRNACTSDADGKVDCYIGNGKIIGEFVCDKVEKYSTSWLDGEDRLNETACLNDADIMDYMNGYTDRIFYAWHISDLKIYDKPKELREFKTQHCEKSEKSCGKCKYFVKIDTPDTYEVDCFVEDGRPIKRPPQSWCYVEELKEYEK